MKNYHLFSILGVVVLTLGSCGKEPADVKIPENKTPESFDLAVTATMTRTAIVDNGDGSYAMQWGAGDRLATYEFIGEEGTKKVSDAVAAPASSTSFVFHGLSSSSTLEYTFVYPESALSKSGSDYYVTIPAAQTLVNGTFDPAADVLVSEFTKLDAVNESSEAINVAFSRVGATAKMTLKGLTAGESIQSVVFSTDTEDIAGSKAVTYNPGAAASIEDGFSASASRSITLTPEVGNEPVVPVNGEYVVWFRLGSATISSEFSVVVTTNVCSYTTVVSSPSPALIFKDSILTEFSATLTASKPAVVPAPGNALAGVAGGTLPFSFTVSTDATHTICSVVVTLTGEGLDLEENFTPGVVSAPISGAFAIPAAQENSVGAITLTLTATASNNEETVWSDVCDVYNTLFIFGDATVSKQNQNRSMEMVHSSGNEFTFKTYVEAANDGFKVWCGSENIIYGQGGATYEAVKEWGNGGEGLLDSSSDSFISIATTGYKVVTVNPVAKTYSVVEDTSVPAEYLPVYAQLHAGYYYNEGSWVYSDWDFIAFKPFPDNLHRYYRDIKSGGAQSSWEHVVLGFAAQNSGNWGTMFGITDTGGYKYVNDYIACSLVEKDTWGDAGKLSEKGASPQGTIFRAVLDTYLLQLSWGPISQYSYPEPDAAE